MAVSLICLAPILARLFRRSKIDDISPDWLENFSVSTYYPMEGLLSSEDISYLSRQPAFDLSLYKKLRRDRLHIFRQYLDRMILDFNRLHFVARYVVAHSQDDQSDVLKQLIRIKIRFCLAVTKTELNYTLCLLGFRTLEAKALIVRLEEMSSHLSSIHSGQASEVIA